MKLQAELDNEKHEIEVKRDGADVYANVDGREYHLEVSEVESNVYLLKHENKIYQIYVAPNEKSNEPARVNVGGNDFEIKLTDPKRMRHSANTGVNASGAAEIKTAMPGKVVRILVEQGAEIKQGEGVLIVEAMKMQNEMKAPKDGLVKEIRVAEGTTVNAGDVLAIIE